jgi:hypothetical protein
MGNQEIVKRRLKVEPRIDLQNFGEDLSRDLFQAKSQQLKTRSEVHQRDLGSHSRRYSRRGMQGDGLPNLLRALGRHLMLSAESSSCIGAVDFESVLARVSWDKAQVVQ